MPLRTDRDFPAWMFQELVGRTIRHIEDMQGADEGLCIIFTDGSVLEVSFSGNEGLILTTEAKRA